jgi:hypothetical protein
MGQVSTASTIELFKECYGDNIDLIPDDNHIGKLLPFSEKGRVGDSFIESVVLTNETGITLSDTTDAFTIAPARAGVTRKASVTPYIAVLPSILPYGVISRSMNDKTSFFRATKFIVKNNLKSHFKFLEILRLYGRSSKLLGYVSYATATYRDASFTDGTGTLTKKDGSTITFTNGINVTDKALLFAPGDFSGLWLGMEGVKVNQVDSTGTIVASGSLATVNAPLGYITVDFVPVAATSTTSHRLCFDGMEAAKDAVGIHNILSNTGTLFGINANNYSLWEGTVVNVNSAKLSLQIIQDGIAQMVLQGGDDSDLDLYVNPRSWATLADEQTNLVRHDSKYKTSEFVNGAEGIKFYSQNGSLTVHSHRMVMEGDAFCLNKNCWLRSGSAEAAFKIPGMEGAQDLIIDLTNQAGYQFRSYSDQYLFCHRPADNIYFKNINDDASS